VSRGALAPLAPLAPIALAVATAPALAVGCSAETPGRAGAGASASAPSSDDAPPPTAASSPIPASTTQLLLVAVDGWDDVTVEISRHERAPGGAWTPVGEPWPAVVGAGGAAWGAGLHGAGPPPGRHGPTKAEGDGKSPAGVFALGAAYGYADAPPAGARAPYTKVGPTWRCIDDGASAHYNRVLDTAGLPVDWSSAEQMRRGDDLYRWVIEVDHNPARAPGAGSCIFLHVWQGGGAGTAGCTAMARADIEALMAWLDPAARPVLVLLPADQLAALRAPWGLPPAP